MWPSIKKTLFYVKEVNNAASCFLNKDFEIHVEILSISKDRQAASV